MGLIRASPPLPSPGMPLETTLTSTVAVAARRAFPGGPARVRSGTGTAAIRQTGPMTPPPGQEPALRLASPSGRWVLFATVLGSAMAAIDATVVGIALPAISLEFHASLVELQWVVTAYTLTLAGLLLVAGALGDRYGRRRGFPAGVVWFAIASLLGGLAPSAGVLIAARALQGVGAALLTPGSLAIIHAAFHPHEQGKAIRALSAFAWIGTAIGPVLG